ncbi:MAG: hypothetical protein ABIM40_08330 [Pseudomonadota bacterium]
MLLTENQKSSIREYIYKKWETCGNCMPWEKGPIWIVPSIELDEAISEAFLDTGVQDQLGIEPYDFMEEIIVELDLSCPSCGSPWDVGGMEIGKPIDSGPIQVTLHIPRINDSDADFQRLFSMLEKVADDNIEVTFDFSLCDFLRPNAIAFLGGLARLIEYRQGRAIFDWGTLNNAKLRTILCQNGFAGEFGYPSPGWPGSSVPYKHDPNPIPDNYAGKRSGGSRPLILWHRPSMSTTY